MQKWQIRKSLSSSLRNPIRPSQQCAFSSHPSLLDDDRPRSRRQTSAKAGRLLQAIANAPSDPPIRQGLRRLAPGGFGPRSTANTDPTQSSGRSTNTDSPGPLKIIRVPSDVPQPRENTERKFVDRRAGSRDNVQQGRPSENSGPLVRRLNDREFRGARAQTREGQRDRLPRQTEYTERSFRPRRDSGRDSTSLETRSQTGAKKLEEGDEDLLNEEDENYPELLEQAIYGHMEIAEKKAGPGIVHFNPQPMKAGELHTSRIGLAAGELGIASAMKQIMGRMGKRDDLEWESDLELARQLYSGQVVRFKDAAEKKRVVDLAEELASNTANRMQKKKGEFVPKLDVGFVPVPKEFKEVIAGKAMRGAYEPVAVVEGSSVKERTMAQLRKSVALNETYTPSQGKSMVDFIAKMWPAESQDSAKRA